jgi:hypothetical protein
MATPRETLTGAAATPKGMEHALATAPAVATSMPDCERDHRVVVLASGHPGVFAGVAGRVAAPLRMYESKSAMQNRRNQGLRLSCDGL